MLWRSSDLVQGKLNLWNIGVEHFRQHLWQFGSNKLKHSRKLVDHVCAVFDALQPLFALWVRVDGRPWRHREYLLERNKAPCHRKINEYPLDDLRHRNVFHSHTQRRERWLESNKTKVLTSIYGWVMQIFNYESIFNTQGWASSFTSEVIWEFSSSQSAIDDYNSIPSRSIHSPVEFELFKTFLLFASIPETYEIFFALPRHEYLHLSGPSTFHSVGVYLLKQHWPASEDYSRLRFSARKRHQSTMIHHLPAPPTHKTVSKWVLNAV